MGVPCYRSLKWMCWQACAFGTVPVWGLQGRQRVLERSSNRDSVFPGSHNEILPLGKATAQHRGGVAEFMSKYCEHLGGVSSREGFFLLCSWEASRGRSARLNSATLRSHANVGFQICKFSNLQALLRLLLRGCRELARQSISVHTAVSRSCFAHARR